MATKESLYKVAIDGQGYLLHDQPKNQQRPMGDAAIFGQYPENIDTLYHDASAYFPWAQTDWSLGFQQEKWKDEGKFKAGENIDVLSEYGAISLMNTHAPIATLDTGHSFGDSEIWNQLLYVGTQVTGSVAKLYSINASDTVTTITTGWSAIDKVNSMTICQDVLVLGLHRSSGAEHTVQTYNGSTFADINTTYADISSVFAVGNRLFASGYVDAASGYNLMYTDDLSAWTTLVTKFGKNKKVIKGVDFNGIAYFLVEDYPSTELWIYTGDADPERAHRFKNLVNADIEVFPSKMVITGEQSGRVIAFEWDGVTLIPSFEEKVSGLSLHSRYLVEHESDVYCQGLRYDLQVWSPGFTIKYGDNNCVPFANYGFGNAHIFFYGTDGSSVKISRQDKDAYAASGWFTTGIYYGAKPAINKLWHSVDITYEPLQSGDSIKVEYSTDREATWTSIGTVTTAGSDNHTFLFPDNTKAKFIQLRITLYSGDGTTTPILNDFVGRFLTLPDYKQAWDLDLKCIDNMQLFARTNKETKWGEDLRNLLRISKWKNNVVTFEDIDYFETLLNGSLTAVATTITVDEVPFDAPEIGRIKIDNEEIFYNGKSKTQFMNCTRGARGTVATTHADDAIVSNKYFVRVIGYSEYMPSFNSSSEREYVATIKLIEQ